MSDGKTAATYRAGLKRFFVCVVLSFFVFSSMPFVALAQDEGDEGSTIGNVAAVADEPSLAPEAEGYDTAETARAIEVNQSYSASLASAEDYDWYRFTLTAPGPTSISFGRDYLPWGESPEGEGWTVVLFADDAVTSIKSLVLVI